MLRDLEIIFFSFILFFTQLFCKLDKIILAILFIAFISCNGNKANNIVKENTEAQIEKEADSFYHAKNDLTSALLYTKLIALDSTKGEYYFRRGVCYSTLLKADGAISDFLKAVQLNYKVADSYRNVAVNYFSINDSLAVHFINKSWDTDSTDKRVKELKLKYEQQWAKEQNDSQEGYR